MNHGLLKLTSLSAITLLSACTGGSPEMERAGEIPVSGCEVNPPAIMASEVPERFIETAADADTMGPEPITDHIYYDFNDILVSDGDTGLTYPAEIEGWIRYPTSEAPVEGWPVVMYLHGRHATCTYLGGVEFLGTECPETDIAGNPLVLTSPIKNYQGYDYMAEHLASHGYIVLSGSANDVNDKDLAGDAGVQARAQIILRTLDMFRAINNGERTTDDGDPTDANLSTNDFSALVGAMNFDKVGLMGHSRGGQAVSHVVNYNRGSDRGAEGEIDAPHNLAAIFALAPTDFDEITVTNTAFATLLPYCDGDVSNLQGARTFDNSRYVDGQENGLLFQITTMGANHNYYNTVWTNDDYSNGYEWCSRDVENNGRDNPENQRRHGEFLMSSFFRLFLGDEKQFLSYWQGNAHLPESACPLDDEGNVIYPCDDRAHLSVIADPANRLVVDNVLTDASLSANTLGGSNAVEGFSAASHCHPTTGGAGCPSDPTYSRAPQLALSWDSESSLTTTFEPTDVSGMDSFSFRIGVNEDGSRNEHGQDLSVKLTDCNGRSASVNAADYSGALFYPPGAADYSEGKKLTQNSVLIPLEAFPGIDHANITSTSLVFDQTAQGDVQLTDILFQDIQSAF